MRPKTSVLRTETAKVNARTVASMWMASRRGIPAGPAWRRSQTLPSATDAELGALAVPVGVLPAEPPGPVHPRSAVDALLRLLPSAAELPGCPEAPRLEFQARREAFLDAVAAFASG